MAVLNAARQIAEPLQPEPRPITHVPADMVAATGASEGSQKHRTSKGKGKGKVQAKLQGKDSGKGKGKAQDGNADTDDDVYEDSEVKVDKGEGEDQEDDGDDLKGKKRPARSRNTVTVPPAKKVKSDKIMGASSGPRPSLHLENKTAKAEMAANGLEMAASTHGTRFHSIGVFLRDDKVTFWYLDASGVVRTTGQLEELSIIYDFDRVAAIFTALSFCTPEQLGAFPPSIISPPLNAPYPTSFPPETLAGFTIDLSVPEDKTSSIVTLDEHVYSQYTLFGRRTIVYKASSTSIDTGGRALAVKLSQQFTGRVSEVELINHARDCNAADHLPEILKAKDLCKLSEGMRQYFMLEEDQTWDDRILRCIVTPLYLPLEERLCQSPESLMIMARQMVDCASSSCFCVVLWLINDLHRHTWPPLQCVSSAS